MPRVLYENTIVIIEKLRLSCNVGAGKAERAAKQAVLIDIACDVQTSLKFREDDHISECVNYVPIIKAVKQLVETGSWRLLEILAVDIGVLCFKDTRVNRVVVTIRKPNKLPNVEAVGVTRVMRRDRERGN